MRAQRRQLLRAMEHEEFNATLAYLLANGLVVFVLTQRSVEFRVTPKGRLWLSSVDVFQPSEAPA